MMRALVLICAVVVSCPAGAGPLLQAYQDAMRNDPGFQAARAELASARQTVPMAGSALLPSASVTLSDAVVIGARKIDSLGSNSTSALDYRTPNQALNVRFPLINVEARRKLRHAEVQEAFAEATFAAKHADLLDRVATALLQVITARGQVGTASVEADAARTQRDQARRRLQAGEGTLPELADAEAALSMATVVLVDARNQLSLVQLGFRQMTGGESGDGSTQSTPALLALAERATASDLPTLSELLNAAETNSPTILARKHAVTMAQLAMGRSEAGYLPKADIVFSASTSKNDSISTLNQSVRQNSLGFQLNVPIDTGGYVKASVSQAVAELQKAEAELALERRSLALDLTRLYLQLDAGANKLEAHRLAVKSSALALESTRRGSANGMATLGDLATAQQRHAKTQRAMNDFLQEICLARIRLLLRAGSPADAVAASFD